MAESTTTPVAPKRAPLDVRLRLATPSDVPDLARISAAASLDDPMDDFLYPERRQHLEAYEQIYLRDHKYRVETRLSWMVCAEVHADNLDDKPNQIYDNPAVPGHQTGPTPKTHQIVGYATWNRETDGSNFHSTIQLMQTKFDLPNNRAGMTPLRNLVRKIDHNSPTHDIHDLLNPAHSWRQARRFGVKINGERFQSVYDDPHWEEPDDHWYLSDLAVHPDFQGRGVGTKLVGWGLKYAKEEGLVALLDSSPKGRAVYAKCGFKRVGVWTWAKEKYLREGQIGKFETLRWDPPGGIERSSGSQHQSSNEKALRIESAARQVVLMGTFLAVWTMPSETYKMLEQAEKGG